MRTNVVRPFRASCNRGATVKSPCRNASPRDSVSSFTSISARSSPPRIQCASHQIERCRRTAGKWAANGGRCARIVKAPAAQSPAGSAGHSAASPACLLHVLLEHIHALRAGKIQEHRRAGVRLRVGRLGGWIVSLALSAWASKPEQPPFHHWWEPCTGLVLWHATLAKPVKPVLSDHQMT